MPRPFPRPDEPGLPLTGSERTRTATRTRARPGSTAVCLSWVLVLAGVILGPLWVGAGFALTHDMVAVPQQELRPWMWGGTAAPPRAVPQDVFVAVLDDVMPGALLQRLLLAAALVAAGLGVAALLRPVGLPGQLTSMTAYVWSAYVYERLVVGHWGLLLAFAALPWVVLLAGRARDGLRGAAGGLVGVVFLGTWVPSGGVLLAAVALGVLVWPGASAGWRLRAWASAGVLAVQATWLVPALLAVGPGAGSSGVFGLRPHRVAGAILAALGGSGIWNESAVPASRSGALGVVATALLTVLTLIGLRPLAVLLGPGVFRPLALVSVVLFAWSVATAVPALADAVAAVERLPGGGLLRDGQKWLAPWWLLASLAVGAGATRLRRGLPADRGALGYALVLLPLVLLPDLAWGAMGRVAPAEYPADWQQVGQVLVEAGDDQAVVSLPWSTFRRYAWNDDRTVLDPAPRYLPREVVADSVLLVGRSGSPTVVPGDDPRSAQVERALGDPDPVAALRSAGVGWVLLQRDQPAGRLPVALGGLAGVREVWSGRWLTLLRLDGPVAEPPGAEHRVAIATAWVIALASAAVGGVVALRERLLAPNR